MLKYYDIGLGNSANKTNIFILTGEHPREMIAVELVYSLMKLLCDKYNSTMKY
jgi:hypothetical protein